MTAIRVSERLKFRDQEELEAHIWGIKDYWVKEQREADATGTTIPMSLAIIDREKGWVTMYVRVNGPGRAA
jgi:hypothetical protein